MPKRVDHEERRQQIADALLRTAAARGLHATGMREVAAEAGVSLRLVQYYFGTKEELLLAAMQHLAARFAARAAARFKEASGSGGPANPRDVIAAILAEALPADDERRAFHVIYTAYLALSLTDPALAIAPLVKNSDTVIDVVAAQLRAAQAAGDTPAHLDPDLEAFSLMAISAGLATSVLAGQSSAGQAQAVTDYHLDRLFPPSRPALRRAPMKVRKALSRPKMPPSRPTARERRPCRPSSNGSGHRGAIAAHAQGKTGVRLTGTPVLDQRLQRILTLTAGYAQNFWIGARDALTPGVPTDLLTTALDRSGHQRHEKVDTLGRSTQLDGGSLCSYWIPCRKIVMLFSLMRDVPVRDDQVIVHWRSDAGSICLMRAFTRRRKQAIKLEGRHAWCAAAPCQGSDGFLGGDDVLVAGPPAENLAGVLNGKKPDSAAFVKAVESVHKQARLSCLVMNELYLSES